MASSVAVKKPGMLFCWLSGYTESYRPPGWHAPWKLEVAHIASGQGRAVRVDDVRAVILLCPLAHRLHVSDADRLPVMTVAGRTWPTIDERHTLWLKKKLDPKNYDEKFLGKIWVGKLPTPVKPPQFWMDEFFR